MTATSPSTCWVLNGDRNISIDVLAVPSTCWPLSGDAVSGRLRRLSVDDAASTCVHYGAAGVAPASVRVLKLGLHL